jgi:hypothetical protein
MCQGWLVFLQIAEGGDDRIGRHGSEPKRHAPAHSRNILATNDLVGIESQVPKHRHHFRAVDAHGNTD